MNESVKKGISEALIKYVKEHNITQITVHNVTKVPKVHINQILQGKFTYSTDKQTGDIPEKHFIALAELVDYKWKKTYWENKNTTQLSQALSFLTSSKKESTTRVIVGVTGCGKSNTLKLYKKRNPYDVFSVTVGSEDTLSSLLDKVADALNIGVPKNKAAKIRDIAKHLKSLRSRGKNPQLIFDEAEYLKTSALCTFKEFYDYLIGVCSLVLFGTPQLIKRIEKLRDNDAKGIPQLYRRIKFGIVELDPIDRRFTDFLGGIKDKKVVTWLQTNCANYGELHDVLVPCLKESDRVGEPLSVKFIHKVLGMSYREDAA